MCYRRIMWRFSIEMNFNFNYNIALVLARRGYVSEDNEEIAYEK